MLGKRIKELRKARGMTAAEFSQRINVTAGYVSQIEHDTVEPSLAVLRKVSATLGVSLADLFAQENRGGVILTPLEKRTKIKFADINIEYEFLTPASMTSENGLKLEMVAFRLSPKSYASDEIMIHEAMECTFVLKGEIEYHIRGEVFTVREQGSIYVPENTPHIIYNPGDSEAHAIGIISPPVY